MTLLKTAVNSGACGPLRTPGWEMFVHDIARLQELQEGDEGAVGAKRQGVVPAHATGLGYLLDVERQARGEVRFVASDLEWMRDAFAEDTEAVLWRRAREVIGKFVADRADVAERHDHYLAQEMGP